MMMTMMMVETSAGAAARFPAGANFRPSTTSTHNRLSLNFEEANGIRFTSCPLIRSGSFNIIRSKLHMLNGGCLLRRSRVLKNRIRASSEHLSSASDSSKKNDSRRNYHPFEEIGESISGNDGDAMLTAQETSRTIVEVNSKATIILTCLIDNEIHENIIWPELPYVTDEHGNIYFQVKNDEDILQTITSENNLVQAIIGFDAAELLNEMEESGSSEIDFGFEEITDEDSDEEDDDDEDDDDEDYDEELVAIIDDEDEDSDSDESLGDWAKLETVNSSHPMYFAKKLSQVASDDPIDCMEKPPAGLAIQGLIRPAFIEEHSDIQRRISSCQSDDADINKVEKNVEGKLEDPGRINGRRQEPESSEGISSWSEESGKDQVPQNGTSFYKLEMIKIQLISADGYHTTVEIEDFRKAQPDAIAHSASKIISRFKAGGEKSTQALKSLCWRSKSVQVEEAALIGVDSLGFDVRVCSGAQIQTLRLAFSPRATSEYSAERQLNDLLFPRITNKMPIKKHPHQNEL
ncbi:Pentatricopeptide repeat (PPR) superfamily protein [Euphorbia peplus]|nr:Pentatricopeptide repeat (PPR) superfamily protein [Euphorbia peplus]